MSGLPTNGDIGPRMEKPKKCDQCLYRSNAGNAQACKGCPYNPKRSK